MIKKIFAHAPHAPRVPADQIDSKYTYLRWAVLESTFLGYAVFYIVRNNLSAVAKDVGEALHYDYAMIGNILAISSIAYGVGKFLMGALSDRSNPRKFMAFGLLLTAACNFGFGWVQSYSVHLLLWGLNGLFQGMGWPPCGRSIGHWFSLRERGTVFAIWNVAHNIGGGVAGIIAAWATLHYGWAYAFYFPGLIALVGAFYVFLRLRDTPQSEGLPSIEEYKHDYAAEIPVGRLPEQELTIRDILLHHIINNKYLWLFACANFFVYIVRYSMLDWGPAYLRDVKEADIAGGGFAVLMIEFGGIPSTLLFGWLSDRFDGRRGMVSLLCMLPILAAFLGIITTPAGWLWLDMTLLAVIGFFIYPPVMLLGVAALDLTSKKAVGTAAGFVGLFGYMGRTAQDKLFGWLVYILSPTYGLEAAWNIVLFCIVGCTLTAIVLLVFTWHIRPRA